MAAICKTKDTSIISSRERQCRELGRLRLRLLLAVFNVAASGRRLPGTACLRYCFAAGRTALCARIAVSRVSKWRAIHRHDELSCLPPRYAAYRRLAPPEFSLPAGKAWQ